MNPTILVFGQIPPPYHGSNVMTQTAIEALQSKGYRVIFVNKGFSKTVDSVGRFSLRKVLRIPVLMAALWRISHRERPTLCLYFNATGLRPFLVDCLMLWVLRRCCIPYVLYLHGKGFNRLDGTAHSILRHIVRNALSHAHGGIVLGETLKRDVSHAIPIERLQVLFNAIPNAPVPVREASPKVIQVLFLSNLIPSKGPAEVLRVAQLVTPQMPNVHFLLVGADRDHHYSERLSAFIRENHLGEMVTLYGPAYGSSKEMILANSDIFILPTQDEAFGLVNLEAMRAGLPVISSFEGAIPEILENGLSGFLVDAHDVHAMANLILRLAANPELRQSMGHAARRRYEQCFTPLVYANRLNQCLHFFISVLPEHTLIMHKTYRSTKHEYYP